MQVLRDDLGVKWTERQRKMASAVFQHDYLLYQTSRRNGTSFACCGLLASLCAEEENTGKYVMFSVSRHQALEMRNAFDAMLPSCKAQVDFVASTDPYEMTDDIKLIIVDNAEHCAPAIFFKTVVPHVQKNNCKLVMTYTDEDEWIRSMREYGNFHFEAEE